MFNIFYRGSSDIIPLKDIGFINSYKKYYNKYILILICIINKIIILNNIKILK